MWEIRDKSGHPRALVESIEYNGKWLDECYVTVTVESSAPIDFQIGDWIEYRGERFEINYEPGKIKSAPRIVKGDSFKYENIKFNSLADELVRCDFLDIVINDNNVHFTGLPRFSFYAASVKDLADRIQANLDRCYPGMWKVEVHPEFADKTDLNVTVEKWKVWDALKSAVDDFGAYFTVRNRHIVIGTAGLPAGHLFRYGPGNGLYEIEQNADSEQLVCTRVRAYGSTRNLPHRYYHNIPTIDRANVPIHSIASKDYINGGGAACVISFRFLEQYVDFSKCVQDAQKYWFTVTINDISYAAYWDVSKNVYVVGYTPPKAVNCPNTVLRAEEMEKINTGTTVSFEAYREGAPGIVKSIGVPNNMAVNFLMLPGFPSLTQDPYIDSPNIDKLGIREHTIFFDGSDPELEEINPTIEDMTADDLLEAGLPCNSTGELDVLTGADKIEDDGVGKITGDKSELDEKDSYFKVTVKDLGFNINECLIEGNSETPAISFRSGKLGGREFEIFSCTPIIVSDKTTGYELELKRIYDDGIKLWFPYKDYNAEAGDKFVLLNIGMPGVYVNAASQRLLKAAAKWLSKHDYSRSIYSPKIDEIFMARQHDEAMASNGSIASLHDNLKEGMLLVFEDKDFNIDASVFIERLTIKEGSTPVPVYEVTLKEEPTVGTLQKMQNQIDSLACGKGQGSGGYNAAQIRELIDAYGGSRFLSKIKSDRTPYDLSVGGNLTAEKNTGSKSFVPGLTGKGWNADNDGNIWGESLFLRRFLEAPELRYNRTEVYSGITWHCPGGGIVESVESIDSDMQYRIHLKLEDGEIGAVSEGDICMGIWHFENNAQNSTKDSDSGTGNFTFAGFRTIYFEIIAIEDKSRNATIQVDLRHSGDIPPQPGMHFVCYGNRTNKDRQKSRYSTRSYERFLDGVNAYEFAEANIMMQFGDLSNLRVRGIEMKGYSAYLSNVYFDGVIRQLQEMPLIQWECFPSVIHCDAQGRPIDEGVTVRAWHVQGSQRVLVNDGVGPGEWHLLWRDTTDQGQGDWEIADGRTWFALHMKEEHPKLEFRVFDDDDNLIAEYEVVNVCDGGKGDKGDKGDTGNDGKTGERGVQGATVRIQGPFETGVMYYAGDQPDENGDYWIDIVWVTDAEGINKTYYKCVRSGTCTASRAPGTVGGSLVWREASYISALFADLIIANAGNIKMLSSGEIVILDSANRICGRIGAPTGTNGVIQWFGGNSLENATYILEKSGRLVLGLKNGRRIELSPDTQQMHVYDAQGQEVVLIDGNDHDLDAAYGASVKGFVRERYTESNQNFSASTGDMVMAESIVIGPEGGKLSGGVYLDSAMTQAVYRNTQQSGSGLQTNESKRSSMTFEIVLVNTLTQSETSLVYDHYSFNGILPTTGSGTMDSPHTPSPHTRRFERTLTQGTYKVVMRVTKSVTGSGSLDEPVGRVTLRDFSMHLKVGNSPKSLIGSNGFISANSTQDYLKAGITDGKYCVEMVSEGMGIRTIGGEIHATDSTGVWKKVKFEFED